MSEKGPLCIRYGGKAIVLSAIASYWADIDHVHFRLKSGQTESIYMHKHADKQKTMEALANYFTNIVEEDDE